MRTTTSPFALPDRLAAKSDPSLIGGDEQHFAAIEASLASSITELRDRLAVVRREPGGSGQSAMDRDMEIHRITARLNSLRRFGLDLCLGRIVGTDVAEPLYIGRLGLTDGDGKRLLLDWRSPAAEPFFAATPAHPMGLESRRRYRWARGQISDYWDEIFTLDGLEVTAALDDQSAFIASLGSDRSSSMRDVLATIQADQDAIIRAGSRGALVVDGGPGTGKTVVALHRAAFLLYSDPRLGHRRGGVLVVGPHQPYLDYVADVLPGLGEEGVQSCTIRDLVPEGATATIEANSEVAKLKSTAGMVKAVERAVSVYERPPTVEIVVETPWRDLWLGPGAWAEAFEAPEPGTPHNEARDQVWEALVDIVRDQIDDEEVSARLVGRYLSHNDEVTAAFAEAWPLLDPAGIVTDLLTVPRYLQACAPWLTTEQIHAVQREHGDAWTLSDLPILDAARQRVGDPTAPHRQRLRDAASAAAQQEMARVVEDLIASDDSELQVMSILRGQDAQNSLVDQAALPSADPDVLSGPFAHIIIDEAQELTDAEWQMLLLRCPSRSFTIVGDRAQARHGFTESWHERLQRIGLVHIDVASLTINYRTPVEIMAEAAPVIRAALPDANVPTSVRTSGNPVMHGTADELGSILRSWVAAHTDGVACVITTRDINADVRHTALQSSPRVRVLTPELAKGLEFDLVVLVDPESFGGGIEGAVDRYVAMTRATQQLVILAGGSR